MLTNDDKAIILLCSHIGLNNEELKPLTLKQWNELAVLISKSNIKRPENLFLMSANDIKAELNIGDLESEHIIKLLSRSVELGIELERLYSRGIKIVTRASNRYPLKLRKKLKDLAPAIIYYCGNLELANEEGIGIVGSRNLKEEYIEFTKELVKNAVKENLVIYSGGARGVDDTSEKEAYIRGGKYISFLADSLEAKIKKREIRDRLSTNKVLLMTATNPSAGFNVGFAMNRNKYIYSLSEATFVIASDYNKGGTWAGAVENLKNGWTKTFIRQDLNSKGIQELIKLGAIPVKDFKDITISNIIKNTNDNNIKESIIEEQLGLENLLQSKEFSEKYEINDDIIDKISKVVDNDNWKDDKVAKDNFDLYYCVIDTILNVVQEEKNINQLTEILNVNKTQVNIWLKRACEENKIKKLTKPVRYIINK